MTILVFSRNTTRVTADAWTAESVGDETTIHLVGGSRMKVRLDAVQFYSRVESGEPTDLTQFQI